MLPSFERRRNDGNDDESQGDWDWYDCEEKWNWDEFDTDSGTLFGTKFGRDDKSCMPLVREYGVTFCENE